MRSIWQDIRYAFRQLRKSPSFAFTAIAVLTLGLGANSAVFTVLNGILLRPLPYAQPDRIAIVVPNGPGQFYAMTYADMVQLHDAMGARMQVGAVVNRSMASLVGPGGRFQAEHSTVTPSLIGLLGIQPAIGRVFRNEESDSGKGHVLLIGDDVWHKLFNADPGVVGKTIAIKSQSYTVIGVMPSGFSLPFGERMQIWSPAELPPGARSAMQGEQSAWIDSFFVRMTDGVSIAQIQDLLTRTQAVIAKEAPGENVAPDVRVSGYLQSLNKQARKPLVLLYAVVLGIWALACMNVTSLMLARAVSRTREQAVRSALGATRMRLLQQSIVESLLLSGIGATAGLLLGQSAIKLLWRQIERHLPLTSAVRFDWRVMIFLIGLTLFTALTVGIYPALRAAGRNVQESLHGVTSTASASQNRTREVLVVAQLALTLVFLVGAGLFLRTINALRAVPLGFMQQNVLTGGIILNGGGRLADTDSAYPNVVRNYYLPLIARLRAIPGVRVATLSSVLPMRSEFAVRIGGDLDHKDLPRDKSPMADGRLASPGLVDALGIPMLRGRFFADEDTSSAPVVVVVNKAFADKYLPGQNPVGHIYSMGKKGRFADAHIIGVIGDVKQNSVTDPTRPEIYFCLAQIEPNTPLYGIATAFIQVAIRGAVPADALRAQFDKALHDVAPDATTTDVKTIHEAVEDSFGSQTLIAHLLETFAGLALMIASVGLYGLLSFLVAQRTREIGLRIALGAPQANILALVLRRAMLLVAAGLCAGCALAWFAVSMAKSYIFGVKLHDAMTFAAVLAVLAAASFLASWLPARRAASVDPILALRSE